MLNSGEFYGQPDPEAGLKLLARFYDANPDYVDKTYLSVKGGMKNMKPDSTYEGLLSSVTNINKVLGGKKKMDLFEPARRDPNVAVEDSMKSMLRLRDEGHFKDIGLSEVSAETIRKAAAVGPIAAVEVEYSPFSLDIEHNGVLDACKELNIPICAYCPLGRGLMDPKIRKHEDIEEGDHRKHSPRFQKGNIEKNVALADKFRAIAEKKGCTGVEVVLAWEIAQSNLLYPIPGSTRKAGVLEAAKAMSVKLDEQDLQDLRKLATEAGRLLCPAHNPNQMS